MVEIIGKSWNFILWSKYFVTWPKEAEFSAFLSQEKLKLVMGKSLNFIAQLLCESWEWMINFFIIKINQNVSDSCLW